MPKPSPWSQRLPESYTLKEFTRLTAGALERINWAEQALLSARGIYKREMEEFPWDTQFANSIRYLRQASSYLDSILRALAGEIGEE